jgi:DNA ligase-1
MTKKSLPTLYHKGKDGKLRQWTVSYDDIKVYTKYGTCDGMLIESSYRVEPKNVGRANATTAAEQAKLEAEASWLFKRDRKYSETKKDAEQPLYLPMLAKEFSGRRRAEAKYPMYLQPKLDGVRCLAKRENDEVTLTSRQGKPWNIPHIAQDLLKFMEDGDVFDGEIYIHGETFQKITSLVRRADPANKNHNPEALKLEYWVYDRPVLAGDEDISFEEREFVNAFSTLTAPVGGAGRIVIVASDSVYDYHEVEGYHDHYAAEGYEGVVLRDPKSKYEWGYRSDGLLKFKKFQDSEFEIVDVIEGIGKMEGHGIFICKSDCSDQTFECSLKGTMAERKELFDNKEDYIGKVLKVKYFNRTDSGLPRFPVGLGVRDPDDM